MGLSSLRRPFAGTVTASSGLVVLLLGLALVDERVRYRLARLASAPSTSGEITTAGLRLRELLEVVFMAVRDQSIEQAPLVIFALAALALLLFMMRT